MITHTRPADREMTDLADNERIMLFTSQSSRRVECVTLRQYCRSANLQKNINNMLSNCNRLSTINKATIYNNYVT